MENKNIIIILLIIIIVILAVMLGSMFMPSLNAQKDSKIVISGNKTLHDGDNLTVKLTDLNKTPIKKESVNITITDKKGKVVVNESVKTNSKGKANVNLDLDPGKYVVNVTFGGNDNFTANSTSKKITIEEEVRQEPVVREQSTASDTSSDTSSSDDELRPEVDSTGITREQADKYGWRYTTEHGGHYRGYHDHWDENAGIYHD